MDAYRHRAKVTHNLHISWIGGPDFQVKKKHKNEPFEYIWPGEAFGEEKIESVENPADQFNYGHHEEERLQNVVDD